MRVAGTHLGIPAWLPIALLPACSEPRIEFRGYTEQSSCRQVIDAELANGSELQDIFDAEDPESTEVVTELTGRFFERDVWIEVACSPRGGVSWVHYVAAASDPVETGEIYAKFGEELGRLFGTPNETFTDDSRAQRFLCPESAPVLLEEYRVDDEAHELYVAFVPDNSACLIAPP